MLCSKMYVRFEAPHRPGFVRTIATILITRSLGLYKADRSKGRSWKGQASDTTLCVLVRSHKYPITVVVHPPLDD